ncbi:MAG: hypothetical protein IJG24_03620 [Selenomonadaceae bacterium]|nr:hypothetical protein [Selenomonadaceae bacterium]
MNRLIKFRARRLNGELVFGFLVTDEFFVYIIDPHTHAHYIVDSRAGVSQLIAVDKNGNEIYEGDKVIRIDGEDYNPEKTFPMFATFDHFSAINNGDIIKEVAA